jgi:hypothetical protein
MAQAASPWRDRLAVLGGVAACVVAAKAARLLWLRAQLSFGPVLVSKYAGQYALVTGGEARLSRVLQQPCHRTPTARLARPLLCHARPHPP